ncbi:hypothetical protein AAHW46_10445 [Klebsiella variicola subsp. variicola]
MLASFINNQRLVRSVGDHLAVYHRLSGTPSTPKLQAQQRLRTDILQGMPASAHQLMSTLSAVLLKYEPRLQRIAVVMLDQHAPGELRYAIDAELKNIGLVRYGTEFMPEGRVLIRHLKRQQYLDARSAL